MQVLVEVGEMVGQEGVLGVITDDEFSGEDAGFELPLGHRCV